MNEKDGTLMGFDIALTRIIYTFPRPPIISPDNAVIVLLRALRFFISQSGVFCMMSEVKRGVCLCFVHQMGGVIQFFPVVQVYPVMMYFHDPKRPSRV